MARVVAFLPRLVALTLVWLLATAALTFAAGQKLSTATPPQAQATTTAAVPTVLVVPDVRRQAYVFAKGILQDAGFAWKVSGKVEGYAANTVVDQVPAPGARVMDTGAPTITLQLAKGAYPQEGAPENASPYDGTVVRSADQASAPAPAAPTRETATAKPAKQGPAKQAVPAKKQPRKRTPAFTFPGAKPEPLDEPPLTARARDLQAWLAKHPKPTDANVKHWLYQHAWIVAGARQGWWHGAEALRILIQVDRRAEALWGIGAKSQAVARTALAEVEKRSS